MYTEYEITRKKSNWIRLHTTLLKGIKSDKDYWRLPPPPGTVRALPDGLGR